MKTFTIARQENLDSSKIYHQPLIVDIKGNSSEDGPGIRSVIFIKGCPLSCAWCHNPEGKKVSQELMYNEEKCISCMECIKECPELAIKKSENNKIQIDRDRCTNCMKCTFICPSKALYPAGESLSVTDIMKRILPYKPFFDISGGGVTLTGGEATLFMEYSAEIFKNCHEYKINTLLETSGMFNQQKFEQILLPHTDMIYMDIKLIDPNAHKKWCGIPNERILENFIWLYHKSIEEKSFSILPRTPLIPNITDTDENIDAIINFYKQNHVTKAAILKNNPMWFDKCNRLGILSKFKDDDKIHHLYNLERFKLITQKFKDANIELV